MPTRDFFDTVRELARDEPGFRKELLNEAVRCMLIGEVEIGCETLRDVVVTNLGFDELARKTGKSLEDLEHILSDGSDPSAGDLLGIVAVVAKHEGIELDVHMAHESRAEELVAA